MTYLKRPAPIDDIVSTLRRIDSTNEGPSSDGYATPIRGCALRMLPLIGRVRRAIRSCHRAAIIVLAARPTPCFLDGPTLGKRHRALSCCGGSYITTFSPGDGSSVSSKTRIRWPRYQRPFGSGATRTPGRHGLLRPGYLPGSRKTGAGARSRRRTDGGCGGRTPQVHGRPASLLARHGDVAQASHRHCRSWQRPPGASR